MSMDLREQKFGIEIELTSILQTVCLIQSFLSPLMFLQVC